MGRPSRRRPVTAGTTESGPRYAVRRKAGGRLVPNASRHTRPATISYTSAFSQRREACGCSGAAPVAGSMAPLTQGNHGQSPGDRFAHGVHTVSYTHLRAHETVLDLVCRLLLE